MEVQPSYFELFQAQFAHFSPAWLIGLVVFWSVYRFTVSKLFAEQAGRIITLSHAAIMIAVSVSVDYGIISNATKFNYVPLLDSLHENQTALVAICNFGCTISSAFFIMDSYFLRDTAYLKHHIGAIVVYLLASYHSAMFIIHCMVGIGFFEIGAVLVQLSRLAPHSSIVRFFICSGYTASRVSLAWVYSFIFFQFYMDWDTFSIIHQIMCVPIASGMLFLLYINARWTLLQWKAMVRLMIANMKKQEVEKVSFYEFHQIVLGNVKNSEKQKAN